MMKLGTTGMVIRTLGLHYKGHLLQFHFLDKNLLLGTWQQIVLIDFDNHSRQREIIVQLSGIKEDEK